MAHQQATGQQFALLTVPSLEGNAIEEYALRVAEAWKLGEKGKDNGLLMLVSAGDRKFRIEVGYGLEGDIPDAFASRVQRDVLTPAFRAGQYGAGITQAFALLGAQGRGEAVALPEPEVPPQRVRRQLPAPVLFIVLAFIVLSMFGGGGGRGRRRRGGVMFGGMLGGGGFGGFGGGGGGGGFGGGGGGRFGGGGASGGW